MPWLCPRIAVLIGWVGPWHRQYQTLPRRLLSAANAEKHH